MVKVIWHKAASPLQTDGSIVFARLCQRSLMGGHVTLAPPGEYDWTGAFFGPSESTIRTATQLVQPFLHRWPQSVAVLYNGTPLPPSPSKLSLPMGGSGPQSNTWFSGINRDLNPDGISLGSAVLQGSPVWQTDRQTDRPTDHATWLLTIGRVYVCSTAMQPKRLLCVAFWSDLMGTSQTT